jgi:HEAT repeats
MEASHNNAQADAAVQPSRRRAPWPLIILTALFIIVPFLTWYGTWFGRTLSDEQIATYLVDEKNPRHIQHALSQVADRIQRHDPNVKKFYPQVLALTKSPTGEIRKTAAWVMGQDNNSVEFHQALLALLKDNEPLVRRNAALQLVRFGDASGKPELRAMLQSFEAKSPIAGTVESVLPPGSKIGAGALLARIRDQSNSVMEFRSPVDGAIDRLAAKEGEAISIGQTIVVLTPDRATVIDALRAFAYVGTREDLPLIETLSANATGNAEIKQQAEVSSRAIEKRRSPSEK